MTEIQYTQDFTRAYNASEPDQYGRANMSTVERAGLDKLTQDTKQQMYPNRQLISLSSEERTNLRNEITSTIINDGWPFPDPFPNTGKNLGETAIEHACVVAQHLLVNVRGVDGSQDTIASYVTKNQFDRFVSKKLRESQRIAPKGVLREEWYGLVARQSKDRKPKVAYPPNVDSNYIYGVGKPHRYWPAQLARNLEFIRLRKTSPAEDSKFDVKESDKDKYKIPWSEFSDAVETSGSVNDIAVKIAIKTMQVLKNRGLSDNQITSLIINSYSPRGMIQEHGHVAQIDQIWTQLLSQISQTPQLADLREDLNSQYQQRLSDADK